MSDRRASSRPGDSYLDDTYYLPIENKVEQQYGLPDGLLSRIRKQGERTNRDQVSSAGARSVYQIIPATRNAFLQSAGVNAYAGDSEAAQVAALALKGSLDRNKGNLDAAVHEYVGGTNPKNWGPVTQAYTARVLGKQAPGITPVRGSTATAPGFDWRNVDIHALQGIDAADIGDAKPLGPKPITDAEVAPKPTAAEIMLGEAKVNPLADVTPGSTVATAQEDQERETAADDAEKQRKSISWMDRVKASIDKNWVSQMVVRGLERESYEGDPAWHKEYLKNIDGYESLAQDQDELDMLRDTQAQTSRDGYYATVREIEARRARNKIVDSNDDGWAFDLGTSFVDPAGWVATAGLGKIIQIGKLGAEAGRAASIAFKPALMATVAEGAAVNVGITGLQDYSGESQTVGDYIQSGALGAVMGATLHTVAHLGGALDRSDSPAIKAYTQASKEEAAGITNEAAMKAGPNATEAQHQTAMMEVVVDRAERALRMAVSDRDDTDRFLAKDAENTLTKSKADQTRVAEENNLDGIADPAERGLAVEMAARAKAIVDRASIDGSLDKGLEGRFLKLFGAESDVMTLIRSKNPTLQAVAIQLLESGTGAGGRKPSAAISMVMRNRAYMSHMVDYDQAFELWRKAEGIGPITATFGAQARKDFDRAVFYEVEGRGMNAPRSTNNAVLKAADAWEAGMDHMRQEMQHVGTLGHERLGPDSVGYMRHMMDPGKLLNLDPKQWRTVESIISKQFQDLNEYTFTLRKDSALGKKGEQITRKFDAKFSNKLAKRYLDEALGRGRGSNFVPANLQTSEGASIVADALKEIQGLAPEEKEAIMGKYSRGGPSFTKGRLKLDLSTDIGNGKLLGDLFNQDIMGLYRSYARRTAGEVSLAQYGILGKQGLNTLKRIADLQRAPIPAIKAFERITSEFMGEAWDKYDHIGWARDLRTITSAAQLGGLAFTELGQLGDALFTVGVRGVISVIKDFPRLRREAAQLGRGGGPKNPWLGDLDSTYGHIGGDGYNMLRIFDAPENSVDLYDQRSLGTVRKFIRAGGHMTSVLSGFRMVHAVLERGLAEQIAKKAIRYIHLGQADKALDDMGLNPELRKAFKDNMSDLATFDKDGNITGINIFNAHNLDPRHVQDFAQTILRGSGQILQHTYIGETGAWAHNDFLKLLLQFRTFGITSIEKQYGRQRANYGAIRAFAVLVGSMAFALPIHLARLQVQSLGMSRSQREKFFNERASVAALAQSTMMYTSASGLMPDALDLFGTFGSKVGLLPTGTLSVRGSNAGVTLGTLSPGLGYVDKMLNDTLGGKFQKLPRQLPGGNLPFVFPIINRLDPPTDVAGTAGSTTQSWDAQPPANPTQ